MRFFGLLLVPASVALLACGQEGNTASESTSNASSSASSGAGGTGSSSSSGSGGGPTGTPFKVMDWNVHNFVNNVFDDNIGDDETPQSLSDYQAQVAAIAGVIRDQDPDVVVFAEIENQAVLDVLATALEGAYPHTSLVEGNDPRGLTIAAMSKVPIDETVTHKDDQFDGGNPQENYRFSRDVPEYHLTFEGQRFVLLGVHYRSKGQPDADPPIPDDPDKRLAEGIQTRFIADTLIAADPERAVIVLGDFNDLPDSPVVQAVKGSDFVSAADSVPTDVRWTFDFQGSKELIDHQLSSPVISGQLDTTSVTIPHGAAIDDASDHSPIMATYLIP
jgi:predicted extracellular nuclease